MAKFQIHLLLESTQHHLSDSVTMHMLPQQVIKLKGSLKRPKQSSNLIDKPHLSPTPKGKKKLELRKLESEQQN